jgi:Fe(3+) dicitrate transport protein
VEHDVEIGLRYHEDEEDRFQEDDFYRMSTEGEMVLTTAGTPGSNANRISSADALALFVQDTIDVGRFTLTPGVRLESIDLERVDFVDADRTQVAAVRTNSMDEWIPGLGVRYEIDPSQSVFAGIHRGFAPPGPSSSGDAIAEESVNYELGWRLARGVGHAETTGFLNDYSNLLGTCTASTGCTGDVGDQFNGGAARTWGLEVSSGYEFARNGAVRIPVDLTYTYTRSEFLTSFDSAFEPWGSVQEGDEFPYVPRHQANLGVGFVHQKFSAWTNVVHVDRMRTVAGQGQIPSDESTDETTLLDLTANWFVKPELRIFVQGRNVTDEAYVVARRPAGVRPGLERTVLAGVAFEF